MEALTVREMVLNLAGDIAEANDNTEVSYAIESLLSTLLHCTTDTIVEGSELTQTEIYKIIT